MKYISIDLETTGLDPSSCQVLEIGAIIDDLSDQKPIEELPRFHTYVVHEIIMGQPYALSMHAEIFKRIALKTEPYQYLRPEEIEPKFGCWLWENSVSVFTPAGKNFATFDKPFLETLPGWKENIKARHRVIDPAILYWKPTDDRLPGTEDCMHRAGLGKTVAHTALEDAEVVIELIRRSSLGKEI